MKASTPPLRILFVSSECAPYAKCGGLGDVVAALPKALRAAGHDARVFMPRYGSIDPDRFGLAAPATLSVPAGNGETLDAALWSATADGAVPVSFLEYNRFFDRGGVYDRDGIAFGDQAWRFGFLCLAALEACRQSGWIPDVVHVHDWPTAILPVLLRARRDALPPDQNPFARTASVLTIHNQVFQGWSDPSVLPFLGLDRADVFRPDALEAYGQLNLLKGGIVFSDALATVSPGYAREILSEPAGNGLSPFLRSRAEAGDFTGILNGVDYTLWNPALDPFLSAPSTPYSLTANSLAPGKATCKAALQAELSLPREPDVPLFGFVARLTEQKGARLLLDALPSILGDMPFQLALLGRGDPAVERDFLSAAAARPDRIAVRLDFSESLAHRIYAGSDFFLMPSQFEPCGLSQLYAMAYASLPLVHATGGLDDTVEQYNEGTGAGTGFKYYHPSPRALYDIVGWAVSTYFDRPGHLACLRQRAMSRHFDWASSASRYLSLYRHALTRVRGDS